MNLLNAFGLRQKVLIPTNDGVHTLDLVLEYADDEIVSNVKVSEPMISDHKCVAFDILVERSKLKTQNVRYRNWKNLDTKSIQKTFIKLKLIE